MDCDDALSEERFIDNFSYFVTNNSTLLSSVTFLDSNSSSRVGVQPSDRVQTTLGIYINRVLIPIVLVFGLAGNISNVCILGRKSFRRGLNHIERSALTGLLTLSVSDMMFCLIGLPAAFLPSAPSFAKSHDYFQVAGLFYGIYKIPLINIFLFSSTWLIVWISMERYMAVCHPFQARTAIRTRRTKAAHISIFILSIAINFPLLFSYDVRQNDCYYDVTPARWRETPIIFNAHKITWTVFGTLLPLILLSFCNINILRAVCDADALSDNEGHSRPLSRVTTTLVVMVFLYLVLVTPSMILAFLAGYVNRMSDSNLINFELAIYVTNFCQAVKFSSNFMLYCVTNKQFRDNVKVKSCKTTSSRTVTPDSSTARRYQLVGTNVGNQVTTSSKLTSSKLSPPILTKEHSLFPCDKC